MSRILMRGDSDNRERAPLSRFTKRFLKGGGGKIFQTQSIVDKGARSPERGKKGIFQEEFFTPYQPTVPDASSYSKGSGTSKSLFSPTGIQDSGGNETPFSDIVNGSLREITGGVSVTSVALQDIMGTGEKERGPKVKPFIFTETQQVLQSKPLVTMQCAVCDEALRMKMQSETVIELKCGCFAHEECFQISLDYQRENFLQSSKHDVVTNDGSLVGQIFPRCTNHDVGEKKGCLMVPIDDGYVDKIVADALMRQREHVFNSKLGNVVALSSTLRSSKCASIERGSLKNASMVRPIFPTFASRFHSSLSSEAASMDYQTSNNCLKEKEYSSTKAPSFLRAMSQSPAESISTMNTDSIKMDIYKGVPLETLKNWFIKYFLDNCSNGYALTQKFGDVRLVDRLLVKSKNCVKLESKICYLFEKGLVLWNTDDHRFMIFPLESEKLVFEIRNPTTLEICSTYLSSELERIVLNSELNSVLQKWMVAISDLAFVFPSEVFTSTICLPINNCRSSCTNDIANLPSCSNRSSSPLLAHFPFSSFLSTESSYRRNPTTFGGLQHWNSNSNLASQLDESNSNSDSDSDSDTETIRKVLNKSSNFEFGRVEDDVGKLTKDRHPGNVTKCDPQNVRMGEGLNSMVTDLPRNNDWQDLVADIDNAITSDSFRFR